MDDGYQAPARGWRTFVILWATQSVSVFGSALTLFALNIWLTQALYPAPEQRPQLALALSAISLAFAIPVIFAAPLAGAWADRHDRRRTMMVTDLVSGVVSLALAALVLAGALQLVLLVILMACTSLLAAFHSLSFDTSYSMLVPRERLPRANGMMQTIWALSGVIAPAIAATVIALPALARQGVVQGLPGELLRPLTNGTALAMCLDALTFFGASATLLFLRIPSPVRTDLTRVDAAGHVQRKSIWADVREGAVYIGRRRPLLWLLITFAAVNFAGAPLEVLLPILLKFNLAPDWTARGFSFETALALVSTAFAVGGVAGGLAISAWGGLKRRRIYGVIAPMVVCALCQVAFGLSLQLYVTAAAAALLASLGPMMNAHSQAIWQTQTPNELQGRVFSVRRLIAQFSYPLGTALAGWAGGIFNAGHFIAVLGILLAALCAGQLFNPYMLKVEDKALLDGMAA